MSYTTGAYINEIKLLVPTSETLTGDLDFITAINIARDTIAQFFDPIVLYKEFALTEQQEYDIPTVTGYTMDRIIKIFDSVSVVQDNIQYKLCKGWKEDIGLRNITGYPSFYYIYGSTIGFYPIPQSNMYAQIKLSIKPQALSSNSIDTDFTEEFKPLIIKLACSYVAKMVGNANLSNVFYNEYLKERQMIKTKYR